MGSEAECGYYLKDFVTSINRSSKKTLQKINNFNKSFASINQSIFNLTIRATLAHCLKLFILKGLNGPLQELEEIN